uniref:protein-serine/threonine phosphatase n=1 Tax=Leersia perrieri TaxID=77586 RepID=A0A0D9WZG1_9ORYZ
MASSPQLKVGEEEEDTGRCRRKVTFGYHLAEGKMPHGMEDRHVAVLRRLNDGNEVGLFAVFDGHAGSNVATYLRNHLFDEILSEPGFFPHPDSDDDTTIAAIRRAYDRTDRKLLQNQTYNDDGSGSTAVTAILINGNKLVVANVGDSRAVACDAGSGRARQLSVDHEPVGREREAVEGRGGFVVEFQGDVPRVDAQLAMSRAFGDAGVKEHISADPDVRVEEDVGGVEFVVVASDGVWKVMSNQEAVDVVRRRGMAGGDDAREAAVEIVREAVGRGSTDDIACVVVRLR